MDVHKSLLDEVERHNQVLSAIYTGRPQVHRHHPSDGTGTSSSSTANSRSTSPLPVVEDEAGAAYRPGGHDDEMIWAEEEDVDDDEGAGKNGPHKHLYATCTTFRELPGEPAPSSVFDDERVVDLLEVERFEKSIFVKAALQLLLDKAGGGGGGGESTAVAGTPGSTRARQSVSLVAADDASFPAFSSSSVLRTGFLKKANHHSMSTLWRTKLVEVHQGLFVYEDEDALLVGRRKKSLPLHASICTCRPVASKKNNVFELALKKGSKRLWMCSSEEDRNEWVACITNAMVLLAPSTSDGGGHAIDFTSPHAGDMLRYADLRASVKQAGDRDSYQSAVAALMGKDELCVPFPWIQSQIFPSDGHAAASATTPSSLPFYLKYARRRAAHHAHHHSPQPAHPAPGGSSELTQLWKDLLRDKVCINGQVIYGESGPEAILGALARTLTSLALKAKDYEDARPLTASSTASHSTTHSTHHHHHHHHHRHSSSVAHGPPPLLSALNEVQLVSHTMEILLACNRTQSGGDTYYCVEYLFRNPNLVVVCPYSTHAEPLQISLELVDESTVTAPRPATPVSPTGDHPPHDEGGSTLRYSFAFKSGKQASSSPTRRASRADSLPADASLAGERPSLFSSPHPLFHRTGPVTAPGRQGGHFYDFESSSDHNTGDRRPLTPTSPLAAGGDLKRPVILVKIQANTSYKICPLNPQEDEIWGLASARFEQHFIVSATGLAKSDEFIRIKVTAVNHEERVLDASSMPPPSPFKGIGGLSLRGPPGGEETTPHDGAEAAT